MRRPRVALTAAMAAVVVGGVMVMPAVAGGLGASGNGIVGEFLDEGDAGGTPTQPPAGGTPAGYPSVPHADRSGARQMLTQGMAPRLAPAEVSIASDDFWSWALLDRSTGEITGAPDLAATSTTASMIKVWLAADYLRQASEYGEVIRRQRRADISDMIRDSANEPATELFDELGAEDSIERLIDVCGLTDSAASWRWSLTEVSARDAARMGACVADGRAAGPEWTEWLLTEMRLVRGISDFGIREAFPPLAADQIAIKNGYFARPEDGMWHLNCLAIGPDWSLAVIQRYPEELGLDHGAAICREVAVQLRVDETQLADPSRGPRWR